MAWLNNPRFVRTRDSIIESLRSKIYHFRRVKRVVFLCGGRGSLRRDRLAEYIRRHRSDMLTFYAEDVWPVIAKQPDTNALDMEAQLAALADVVIIVVESPGTFTELGAFSLSPELRKKLLPVLPTQHQGAESFIVTGPVRWIDQESEFAPCIWADHAAILSCANELDDRLNRLSTSGGARVGDIAASPKHLLFLVCDLVAIFGPVPIAHLQYYCRAVVGSCPRPPVPILVGLGSALDLLTPLAGGRYYYRPLENGKLVTFQYKRAYIDFIALRASVLEAMQRINAASEALALMEAANGTG